MGLQVGEDNMTTFISAARLFDGMGGVLDEGCVVVRDGVIAAVEQGLPSSLPSGAEVIRFDRGCLLPGFVDAHNHLGLDDDEPTNDETQMAEPTEAILSRARRTARADLECGVTTLREQGEREYLDLLFRAAISSGEWVGPRLLTAGPWITPSHGHGSWPLSADIADGVEEVRRSVRRHIKAGVDGVKLMVSGGMSDSGRLGASYYTSSEIRTGVEEAHNLGRWVSIHCYGGPAVRIAVEAGVDTIEHCARITDSRDLELIAERGVHLVYTTGVLRKYASIQESYQLALQRALAAGVKMGLGQDTVHGQFSHDAEVLVEYGASPTQALIAMTSGSADACGLLESVGSLRVGKTADVVVVEGDPTKDVSCLKNILFVMKGGEAVVQSRPATV